MISTTINISSPSELVTTSNIVVSSAMPSISSSGIGISMHIQDTAQNVAETSLNINSEGLKLLIYNSEEYYKEASLFFGSLFTGGFNASYMWQLLGAATNEQINTSHITSALSPINSSIQSLADALNLHANNFNIHLTTEDRDFLTRLKAIYGGVYNVALDYLILKNPYEGEINITTQQLALYAGYGGFSAYSGIQDIELEFFNLLYIPKKSGGSPTAEAFFAEDNTYGYGITTLNIPTEEPDDLVEGETGLYVGEGGFTSYSDNTVDKEIIIGYYYEGVFYIDDEYTIEAPLENNLVYIDLLTDTIYVYNEEDDEFIPIGSSGQLIEGYYNTGDGGFYEEDTFTTEISGEEGKIYLDLLTNLLYRYDETETEYILLSPDGQVVEGYYDTASKKFYEEYQSGTFTSEITGKSKVLYVDLLTNLVFRYDTTQSKYIAVSAEGGCLVGGYLYNGNFYTKYTDSGGSRTFSNDDIITGDAKHLYCDLFTMKIYYYDTSSSSYKRLHHKVDIDFALFNTSYSGGISVAQGQMAVYPGTGGFTSTSCGDNYTMIYDWNTIPSRYDDSVYQAYVIYQKINNLPSSGIQSITGNVPIIAVTSNNATFISLATLNTATTAGTLGNSGTIINSITTDSFGRLSAVTTLPYNNSAAASTIVTRRTDSSLASAYLAITSGLSSSSITSLTSGEVALYHGTGGFNSESCGDNYDMIYDWSTVPSQNDDSVYQAYVLYNKINEIAEGSGSINSITGVSPISVVTANKAATVSLNTVSQTHTTGSIINDTAGVILSELSFTESNSNFGRVVGYTTLPYTSSKTALNIAARRGDASLAASYLAITSGLSSSSISNLISGEVAVYHGDGGFTSTSCGDNYLLYGTWPSSSPSSGEDSVISAYATYQKVLDIYSYIDSHSGGGIVATLQAVWDSLTNNSGTYADAEINPYHIPIGKGLTIETVNSVSTIITNLGQGLQFSSVGTIIPDATVVRTAYSGGLSIYIGQTASDIPLPGSRDPNTIYIQLT